MWTATRKTERGGRPLNRRRGQVGAFEFEGRAVGSAANVPRYDFYAYNNSDAAKCQWDILNPNAAYNDLTHLSRRANKRFKSNQMRALFNRLIGLT